MSADAFRPGTRAATLLLAAAVLSAGCSKTEPAAAPGPGGAAKRDPAVEAALARRPDLAKTRVVVLGFDGVDPRMVTDGVKAGRLPNFDRLIKEGAFGPLRTIQPILSPIIWTTVATGKYPTAHGVLDLLVRSDRDPNARVPVTSGQRQVEALWDIAGRYGNSVGLVGWLASHPAERVNGFAVSERTQQLAYLYNSRLDPSDEGKSWPPDLIGTIKPWLRRPGDIPFSEMSPFGGFTPEEYVSSFSLAFTLRNRLNNLRLIYATADNFRVVGERLYRERRPDLFCAYFESFDATAHNFMCYEPPIKWEGAKKDAGAAERFGGTVDAMLRWHDRVLGEWMAAIDPDTVLMVISDHGWLHGEAKIPEDSSFFSREGGARFHLPYGIVGVFGRGVRPGTGMKGMRASVLDVAPTVLALMGFPKAEDMPGKVWTGVFSTDLATGTVPSYESGRATRLARARAEKEPRGGGRADADEDRESLLQNLLAVGYVGTEAEAPSRPLIHMGASYMEQGMYAEAEEAFTEALRAATKEQKPEVLVRLGHIRERLKDPAGAEKRWREALAENPECIPALFSLANACIDRRDFDGALRSYGEILRLKPDVPEVRAKLSDALRERAVAARAGAAGHSPAEQQEVLLAVKRDLDRALEEIRAVAAKDTLSPAGVNIRGMILLDLGRFDQAMEDFRKAADEDPDYVKARNNLGVAYMRMAFTEGLAGEQEPDLAKKREIGMRFRSKADEALRWFDEVLRIQPRHAKAHYNRAVILWRFSPPDAPAAREALVKALEIDPDYRNAKDLLAEVEGRRPGPGSPPSVPPVPPAAAPPKEDR